MAASFPIFIVGAGRSGNTLLRRVVVATEQVYIPPETYEMGEIIRTWPRLFLLPWRLRVWLFCAFFEKHRHFPTFGLPNLNEFAAQAVELPRRQRKLRYLFEAFFLHLGEKSGFHAARWGDKTPYNTMGLREISRTFEDARFVYIYRDGLDVASSYRRAGLYPDLASAAARWVRANRQCHHFGERAPARMRSLRYEDMVSAPEEHLPPLFDWLSLEYSPDVLERVPAGLGDVDQLAHHAATKDAISPRSIGRWRQDLGPQDLAGLPDAFWTQMQRLGYPGTPEAALAGSI
ncbi:MAG: sulfotransferase [Pseudomonadota bacterium]